ncbi:sulfite exporter TauE/SafE family protein [Photobacterium sanctipauli]|uniref:Probable membrane transporter protein n=1 Tax=Photobacterium sanctipauli TaxID=1342794 RepID=A0A2T3NQ42_9GAMM|nr:sulfite exporter TauE/SafE family protein [Photobacterium sanctipauli]PSW18380.1 sulfite exporter TauE/SafE family protein [Photobacterium sanctipauli]
MEELSTLTLLYCALALAAGCFVQSTVGFGMAIVAAPIIFIFEPRFVPGMLTVVGLVLSLINMWQYRRVLSFNGLGAAIIGRIPGSIIAGIMLMYISLQSLSLVLGVGVLLAVAISLLKVRIEPTTKSMFWAGFASGLMGTSTSIGGPPLALVLQHAGASKLRANLAGYFAVSCLMSLVILAATGYFGWWHLKYSLMILPVPILTSIFAYRVQHLIKAEWLRYSLLILCSFSGVVAIWQGISPSAV